MNSSGSSMCLRIHSPTGPISRPSTNGIRQPQLSSAAGVHKWVTKATIAAPENTARHCPTSCHEPYRPLRWAGALSTRKAVALAYSPPVAKPCSMRATTISIACQTIFPSLSVSSSGVPIWSVWK
ncbi:hypothetical protein D3C75_775610 [compost metagenome]